MAKRWSFEEDYIVCKFCIEQQYEDIVFGLLAELVERLVDAGFERRSSPAVYKRAKDFTYLLRGWDAPYAADQVRAIYRAWLARRERTLQIEELKPNSNQTQYSFDDGNSIYESGLLGENRSSINHLVTLEPVAPAFKDLLISFIEKSGMKDSEVYRASFVSRDKFNHIINGRKGKNVKEGDNKNEINASRRTVMQLCIGLKLSYTDAVYLMSCANYAFNPNDDVDRVVVACLKQGIRNMLEVNIELYERNLELFKEPRWSTK